ncbi:pns1, partial [Symbiodinium microadriaticum]
AVVNLFLTKGFATLINDNLLDNVLTMGHLVVGVLCLLVGYGYAVVVGLGQDSSYTILLAMSGFFIGYSMCMLTLNVISSATATVYVCFAENPSTLQTHHPEYFEELMSKWRKFYPEASISIGTVDGQEYAPPAAPAWGSGGVRSSSGGSRGTGLGASSRSGGVSQTGGYFALATSLHDDDTAFAYEGDEEEAEVSLSLNDPPFAADRDVLCDSGEGILQGDVLTGSEKDNGHRSFEV